MTISWHDHVQCHSYVLPSWVSLFPPLWSQYSGKPFACLPQAHPSPQLLIGISHPNISLFIVHIHTQHQTELSSQLYNNVWCKNHVFRCLKVLRTWFVSTTSCEMKAEDKFIWKFLILFVKNLYPTARAFHSHSQPACTQLGWDRPFKLSDWENWPNLFSGNWKPFFPILSTVPDFCLLEKEFKFLIYIKCAWMNIKCLLIPSDNNININIQLLITISLLPWDIIG